MSKHPSSANPALERAILALRMSRPDEAERLAERVLKSDRGNALAAQVLGRALLMQNRAAEAIVPLERAARRSDDPAIETELAVALAAGGARRCGVVPAIAPEVAVALAAVGRRDEALDQLRQTTARRPPFPPAFVEH